MNACEILNLIREEIKADIYNELNGLDRVAELIEAEISRAETRGYFRAMKDIQDGTLERLNSL